MEIKMNVTEKEVCDGLFERARCEQGETFKNKFKRRKLNGVFLRDMGSGSEYISNLLRQIEQHGVQSLCDTDWYIYREYQKYKEFCEYSTMNIVGYDSKFTLMYVADKDGIVHRTVFGFDNKVVEHLSLATPYMVFEADKESDMPGVFHTVFHKQFAS